MDTQQVPGGFVIDREVMEMKPWKCKGGHILGRVVRNGRGIRQLYLYRQAVDYTAEDLQDADVMAIVEGLVMDVQCSVCGSVRTWAPGEEALERLLASARRMHKAGKV